jgi:hypothetical protein
MIFNSACCTLSPEVARDSVGRLQLVDLVDEDDPVLGILDVPVGLLEQPLQGRLDFFIDILGLRQRGRVGGHERYLEHPRQGVAEQGLAGSRRSDEKDIALGECPLVVGEGGDFPVMRVDGYGQNLLGLILADDVLIEIPDDRAGRGFSG